MEMAIPDDKIAAIGKVLNDPNRPLKERFRALFTLRNVGGSIAIESITKCFKDPSALLKHELAYCLGQMQDKTAIPILLSVLEDKNQEPMVRHEAAEALGAIASSEVIPTLQKYSTDAAVEVAETCQLALDRIAWLNKDNSSTDGLTKNPYASIDPTPPAETTNISELKKTLLDEKESLFNRYRAMFALRNIQTEESVLALCEGLTAGSALFKHEVAFVLGQLQEAASVPFLMSSLADTIENEMVRHECAEALGSIATPECVSTLEKYLKDDKRVVRESCEVALDMSEYENSPEFQYADTLLKVAS